MIYGRRTERIKELTCDLVEFRELDGRLLLGRGAQRDERPGFAGDEVP